MALARCGTCGQPKGLKQNYSHFHTSVPPASNRVLCGAPACVGPAHIWLTDEEELQYLSGQRSFRISSHALSVQVA
jgi:hypothetical protein